MFSSCLFSFEGWCVRYLSPLFRLSMASPLSGLRAPLVDFGLKWCSESLVCICWGGSDRPVSQRTRGFGIPSFLSPPPTASREECERRSSFRVRSRFHRVQLAEVGEGASAPFPNRPWTKELLPTFSPLHGRSH